jgi:hypothetical protein
MNGSRGSMERLTVRYRCWSSRPTLTMSPRQVGGGS